MSDCRQLFFLRVWGRILKNIDFGLDHPEVLPRKLGRKLLPVTMVLHGGSSPVTGPSTYIGLSHPDVNGDPIS